MQLSHHWKACGRRPADILSPEAMTPAQLTTEVPMPEKKIDALRTIAMKAYLEAKQSDDLKRDIAAMDLTFPVTRFTILKISQRSSQMESGSKEISLALMAV